MNKLGFTIVQVSDVSLLFVDESEYTMRPANAMLEVKFPSLSACYNMYVTPNTINTVNTSVVGYCNSIISFPDGIYTFRYSIEPNQHKFVDKSFVLFSNAKDKIKTLLETSDVSDELIKKFYKLDVYMQAANANVNTDKNKALDYFNQVEKEIKKLNC